MTFKRTSRFLRAGRIIFTSGLFVLFAAFFPLPTSALQQPAMYSPSCNSTGTQVVLSWSSVRGASNYPLRVDGPGYCAGNVSGPGNWGCYQGVEYLYETAYSGITLSITPGTSYAWWVHAQNGGTWSPATQQSFSCAPPPPPPSTPASCSVWFDTNPITSGSGTYLRWSSSNANSWVYISNIGYVGSSGATWVAPSSSTDYSCLAYGSGGTNGWHGATLTVNAAVPSEPSASASCSSNGDVNISWGSSSGASYYALRVNNTNTYCNGVSGPNNNVGCVSGTDYVEDNIPTYTQSRTVTPSPGGSPVTYWVHGVNSSGWSTNTQRSITCSATPVQAPTVTFSGVPSCTTGSSYSATLTDTNSGGSSMHFAIDWNGDGSVDQYYPSGTTLASGSQTTVSSSVTSAQTAAGMWTVKVRVEDNRGGVSPWASATQYCQMPDPTGQTTTCSADGSSVTMSWNAVTNSGVYEYPLRLDDPAVNGCSIAPYHFSWYCNATNEIELDSAATYQNQRLTATSYTAPVVPGKTYRWWVQTRANTSAPATYGWSPVSSGTHTFTCSATPSEPANTSAANYSCSADGTQATVSWGTSANATSYAFRADNLSTNCGGITGPGTNVWCTPAGYFPGYSGQTDYVDDNIPTSVHSRTISINPAYSPVRWWVHGVVPSGPYANDAYTAEKYATYTYSPWTYREFTCPVPLAPTCSVTLSPNPVSYSSTGTATLTWSATNANTSVYINNVGYVTGGSGSFTVPRSATTDYSCTAVGTGGTGTQTATFTVTPPALPTATLDSSRGTSMQVGQSATITATFSAASNDALSADAIDYPAAGTHVTATSVGSKTYTFTPNGPGTYTFYARATTGYYTSWTTYDSLSITVGAANPACTLSLDPTSVTSGNSSTLSWSSTNSTGGTISGVGAVGPSGSTSVAPSQSTTYTGVFDGPGNSTSQCNGGTGVTLTVTCEPAYTCAGQTIQYTNASCQTSSVTTCVAPDFCSVGSSTCVAPAAIVVITALEANPSLVLEGETTHLFWSLDNANASTCSVTGSDGTTVSEGAASSGADGVETASVDSQTTFTLACTGEDGQPFTDSVTVNVVPLWVEF